MNGGDNTQNIGNPPAIPPRPISPIPMRKVPPPPKSENQFGANTMSLLADLDNDDPPPRPTSPLPTRKVSTPKLPETPGVKESVTLKDPTMFGLSNPEDNRKRVVACKEKVDAVRQRLYEIEKNKKDYFGVMGIKSLSSDKIPDDVFMGFGNPNNWSNSDKYQKSLQIVQYMNYVIHNELKPNNEGRSDSNLPAKQLTMIQAIRKGKCPIELSVAERLVNAIEPLEKKGFFSRMFGSDENFVEGGCDKCHTTLYILIAFIIVILLVLFYFKDSIMPAPVIPVTV